MNRALLFTILSGLSFSCTNYTDNISMTAEHPVLPILTMKEANPVFKIELIRHQTGDNYSLQKLEVDLHGTTDIDDIESVGLYHTDSKGSRFSKQYPHLKKLFSIQIFQLIRTPSLFGYPLS